MADAKYRALFGLQETQGAFGVLLQSLDCKSAADVRDTDLPDDLKDAIAKIGRHLDLAVAKARRLMTEGRQDATD